MRGRLIADQRARRKGVSLLEVLAASTVMAMSLVPALRLMTSSLEASRELEASEAMATLAMSMLEFDSGQTAGTWDLSSRLRTDLGHKVGVPALLVTTARSDAVSRGGVPGSLAVIEVTAWQDANRNRVLDAGERSVRFATKVAKFVSYAYEARNS